jgi:hypothetical protein
VSRTKEEARNCWTLPETLCVTRDDNFKAYAEENYYLRDEEFSEGDGEEDGYFSDGMLPTSERDKVDDDFFFQHLLDEEDNVKYPLGVEGNAPHDGDGSELLRTAGMDKVNTILGVEVEEVNITRNADTRQEGFCGPMKFDGNDFNTVPFCQLVNVCDWVDKKRCIANLAPLPCQYSGGCIKYAHHLIANKWTFANNVWHCNILQGPSPWIPEFHCFEYESTQSAT